MLRLPAPVTRMLTVLCSIGAGPLTILPTAVSHRFYRRLNQFRHEVALQEARRWLFTPGTVNGRPVPMVVSIVEHLADSDPGFGPYTSGATPK